MRWSLKRSLALHIYGGWMEQQRNME
jgi:hypothetical protein